MDPEYEKAQAQSGEILLDLNIQLHLMQATTLAAEGEYEQAISLLEKLPAQAQASGAISDLSARIAAQKGDLKKAEAYWSSAVAAEPENLAYQSGLEQVRADIRRPGLLRWTYRRLGSFFILLLAMAMIYLGLNLLKEIQFTQTVIVQRIDLLEGIVVEGMDVGEDAAELALDSLAADLQSFQWVMSDDMEVLNRDLSALANEINQLSITQSEFLSQLQGETLEVFELGILGIETIEDGGQIEIRFEEGLFSFGSTFREGGREIILELAEALEPYLATYHLSVVGFANDIDLEASEVTSLIQLRADRVVELLAEATNLSVEDIAIELPGDRPAPYPNTSLQNRLRNRTVLILLTPLTQ